MVSVITRRQFLKRVGYATIAGAAYTRFGNVLVPTSSTLHGAEYGLGKLIVLNRDIIYSPILFARLIRLHMMFENVDNKSFFLAMELEKDRIDSQTVIEIYNRSVEYIMKDRGVMAARL